MAQRIHTKDGIIDADGFLIDEEGNVTTNKPMERVNLNDLNIIGTYFWFNDLQGRLKQELHPPGEYHGRPRMYVKEDIEQHENDNLATSHLHIYNGKELKAYTSKTMPLYKEIRDAQSFTRDHYNDSTDYRIHMRKMADYLLNHGGWKLHEVSAPKTQSRTIKKKIVPTRKPKKVVKKVIKKVVCKCKRK